MLESTSISPWPTTSDRMRKSNYQNSKNSIWVSKLPIKSVIAWWLNSAKNMSKKLLNSANPNAKSTLWRFKSALLKNKMKFNVNSSLIKSLFKTNKSLLRKTLVRSGSIDMKRNKKPIFRRILSTLSWRASYSNCRSPSKALERLEKCSQCRKGTYSKSYRVFKENLLRSRLNLSVWIETSKQKTS